MVQLRKTVKKRNVPRSSREEVVAAAKDFNDIGGGGIV